VLVIAAYLANKHEDSAKCTQRECTHIQHTREGGEKERDRQR